MPGAMPTEMPQTGVIVASADYIQSMITQATREGYRLAMADINSNAPMTEAEAAQYLKRPKGSLKVWRSRGQGPEYSQDGSKIWYMRRDIDAYLAKKKIRTIDSITK